MRKFVGELSPFEKLIKAGEKYFGELDDEDLLWALYRTCVHTRVEDTVKGEIYHSATGLLRNFSYKEHPVYRTGGWGSTARIDVDISPRIYELKALVDALVEVREQQEKMEREGEDDE